MGAVATFLEGESALSQCIDGIEQLLYRHKSVTSLTDQSVLPCPGILESSNAIPVVTLPASTLRSSSLPLLKPKNVERLGILACIR